MRELATIRTISNLEPIDGADNILTATVDGWQLVVKKEEFQVGDPCVYFEIDSFIPVMGAIMHLENKFSTYQGVPGLRIKTIKLRGQVSQGLALPLRACGVEEWGWHDVTEQLDVRLWEKPIPSEMQGVMRGNFPSFIPKTRQDRVQNLTKVLPQLIGQTFEVTQKMDGASMTIYCVNEEIDAGILGLNDAPRVGVCSRNMDLDMTAVDNFHIVAAEEGGWLDAMRFFPGYAVQGELLGPRVYQNRENFDKLTFMVFDVYTIDEGRYLTPLERYVFLEDLRGLGVEADHVPILISVFDMHEENANSKALLAITESLCGSRFEGLVFKQNVGEFSFKAISNAYLLKHGD